MRIPLLSWLFLIPFFTISVSSQCLNEQKSLLLQLKNTLSFNPENSTILTNWTQTLDCCQWKGVTCDQNGCVTGLDLSSESISSGIDHSSALFSLSSLETLNLTYNSLNSSPIPSSIGDLTNLRHLNLSNSGFSGQIPTGLSLLTRLVTLDLSTQNYLGNHSLKIEKPNLSTLFGNHGGVVELYLDGVNISANGYEWVQAISSSMPNLRVLSLSNCHLSGPISDGIDNSSTLFSLRYLETLNLAYNRLNSSLIPSNIGDLTNLRYLNLSNSGFSGQVPIGLSLLTRLVTLDLSTLYFPGTRSLQIENTNLSTLIGSLSGVKELHLDGVNISANGYEWGRAISSSMRYLSKLSLSNCYLSGPIDPSLLNLQFLSEINLSKNNLSSTVPYFFADLPNLKVLRLSSSNLYGAFPENILQQKLVLSNNKLGGQISGFLPNGSLSKLDTLDLSSNILEGLIPSYFFDFLRLKVLSLSFNKFSGTIDLTTIQRLQNLTRLELSYNNLSVHASVNISSLSSFPQLNVLSLASCNLQKFPELMNQSRITHLDLSDNQIPGIIPNWIWRVGNRSLAYNSLGHLNLSCNLLVGLQSKYTMPSLGVLDLHSNKLSGDIPLPPETAIYVDYSSNNFNTSIPGEIGRGISFANFFSLANNALTGPIPPRSICNGSYLQVLDLSNNMLNGTIPRCLIENCTETLGVLNLGNNSLSGNLSGTFPQGCVLKTLDLNRNHLEGHVPESLSNCPMLEVLNLGGNNMNGNFTCFLKNSSNLRVLVLRSNGFQGDIRCAGLNNSTWPKLQIIDLASNNFSGDLPPKCFLHWNGMMIDRSYSHLRYEFLKLNNFYYQDKVTVTLKGLEIELVKILTLFTAS
ncbi:hypothetical protein RHMOL_Rhmol05G0308000 [Rhododendron molle]|uniref:Uncharacterized protein n=1 Tax=Rhododendron molle TaxID=49168 RepID=A0ACC0NWD7_RHOML|nr:hypothetical protein RHMOL_Rhmol05G0308000 [Rhododendron molle]